MSNASSPEPLTFPYPTHDIRQFSAAPPKCHMCMWAAPRPDSSHSCLLAHRSESSDQIDFSAYFLLLAHRFLGSAAAIRVGLPGVHGAIARNSIQVIVVSALDV